MSSLEMSRKCSSSIFSFIDGHFLIAVLGRTSQLKGVAAASRLLFGWQRGESVTQIGRRENART